MKNTLKDIYKVMLSRRFMILSTYICIILLSIASTITFSSFTSRSEAEVANIKVANMNYNLVINGEQSRILYVPANKEIIVNIIINSLNNIDSKYELIYGVCPTEDCTSLIETPEDLFVEYSSRTIDPITDVIESGKFKQVRLGITNNTDNGYYLIFGINAGYIHNTLALENQIINEYNEEDVTIAAIIEGELSTTFPTTGMYSAIVECQTNNGLSNASGNASWNGTKWIVNIIGADSGKTVCNVNFAEPCASGNCIKDLILAQGGGVSAIEAKGTPDFSVINGESGLYAADDNYGTSYYYRGLKTELNNNLIWGGFQWKIVRINGDGSIRLVYNGTEAQFNSSGSVNTTGADTQIGTSAFNLAQIDAKYVGYMYGGQYGYSSVSRSGAVKNETNSNIKSYLDSWYSTNISGKLFESQVINNLFCNDRQLRSEVGGAATGAGYERIDTYYAAHYRIETDKIPTLECGRKNDCFTTSADIEKGNGNLTKSIGLLTADEASMAGLLQETNNSTNYLYTNQTWWTLSPYRMIGGGFAQVWSINHTGSLFGNQLYVPYGVRPVISISEMTIVEGIGSETNPYKSLQQAL